MTPTLKALKIINDITITNPTQFARFMWPDSPGWERWSNAGASGGSRQGQGPKMAAGAYLSRLEKRGLIQVQFKSGRLPGDDREWYLTESGKNALKEKKIS